MLKWLKGKEMSDNVCKKRKQIGKNGTPSVYYREPTVCYKCNGTGKLTNINGLIPGSIYECNTCDGSGSLS